MEILKRGKNPDWPKTVECVKCKSILSIIEEDVIPPYDEKECPHIFCPVCQDCLCV